MGARIYTSVVTIGNVSIYQVNADPNGVLTASLGSIAIRSDAAPGNLYQNSDGGTTWVPVGGGGGGEDLAATLVLGNITGGRDIEVSQTDKIRGEPAVVGSGLPGFPLIVTGGAGDGAYPAGGFGALQSRIGGNPRGIGAIDLQFSRFVTATSVAATDYSSIIGGYRNEVSAGGFSWTAGIFGGWRNIIDGVNLPNSAIVGGERNHINGTLNGAYDAFIAGGFSNDIGERAHHSAIVGGLNNQILGDYGGAGVDAQACLVGGSSNSIFGMPGINASFSMAMGSGNTIYGATNSFALGVANRVLPGWGAVTGALAGGNNCDQSAPRSFMWGFQCNNHPRATYSWTGGGWGYSYVMGQTAHSATGNGLFGNGAIQRAFYTLGGQTNDGVTPVQLTTDAQGVGANNLLFVKIGKTYSFRVLISARDTTTGDSATWDVIGAIKRSAAVGSTTLIGKVGDGVPLFSDLAAAGWTAVVSADPVTETLRIDVTAVGAVNPVRWSAHVYDAEAGDNT